MVTTDIASVRREFANRIANLAGVSSRSLIEAFAAVPRENFLGPGPWQTMRSPFAGGYTDTPDANPIHLYDTVVVALDSSRHLNNGEPTGLATWLDRLGTAPGVRFLHVGCGVGYYTAVVAHAVSPLGTVLALEADAGLAERAKRNLAGYANVEVRCATEANGTDEPFDAIFVNAGATEVHQSWIDRLRHGGRLLVPLTMSIGPAGRAGHIGGGHMLRVERHHRSYAARFISPVGIFHCIGARTEVGERLLGEALQRGNIGMVQSLRRDRHESEPECWLHRSSFCLSLNPLNL